jgi:hypothetical protein
MADNFLAFTKKYGWVVAVTAPAGGAPGYHTVPGKYGIVEKDVLARADLPPIPASI